jgi:methanogenic corrinoid protein MtbC1
MDEVGRDFKAGDLFVPEVLIAARAMHAATIRCALCSPCSSH